jgi:hypothetical protein
LVLSNRERLAAWSHDFQGRDAQRLRRLARSEVIALGRRHLDRFGLDPAEGTHDPDSALVDRPLIVTGHQPEIFHPGVWVKNFALSGLARSTGGLGLNLIVDNDIPKAAAIRVPGVVGDRLLPQWVSFDTSAEESPYEDRAVQDESVFRSFADRVLATLDHGPSDPLIRSAWPVAVEASRETSLAGLRLAAMRRAREQEWGVRNLELPLGAVCETESFSWFCSHLLAHLPRFREVHNQALGDYRRLYGIRSRNHPVADLESEGDWSEAPFWAWRADKARRRPLLVRQRDAKTLELRLGGEKAPFAELLLGPDRDACCAVDRLLELPAEGIRLRTRALTTTMFARLLLGDLFIHGIGGAKYDELGDEIIRGFFGFEPPPFWTLSLTQRLGLPRTPADPRRLAELRREIRTLQYNPDRWLVPEAVPEVLALVDEKARAIAGPLETRKQRVARFREIQRINRELGRFVAEPIRVLQEEIPRLDAGLAWNRVADSREYAWVLHDHARLESALIPWAGDPQGGPWKAP